MKQKKLSELTLLDKFLFDETMDDPVAHEAALQIIFGQENLNLLEATHTEKEVRTTSWLRSIRLDVYAVGDDETVYNTEMQASWRDDLARRSRYYQGVIDASLLEPGVPNFNRLNDVCIIMIMPFDPFGQEKYCYTFREMCSEDGELPLNDGALRIFLNTKGTNDHEVSKELVDFLHYIETVDGEIAQRSGNERLQKIHTRVSRIKQSEVVGVKYMQRWEEKYYDRQEGRDEGLKEGLKQGQEEGRLSALLESVHSLMVNMNMTADQAMETLRIPNSTCEVLRARLAEVLGDKTK